MGTAIAETKTTRTNVSVPIQSLNRCQDRVHFRTAWRRALYSACFTPHASQLASNCLLLLFAFQPAVQACDKLVKHVHAKAANAAGTIQDLKAGNNMNRVIGRLIPQLRSDVYDDHQEDGLNVSVNLRDDRYRHETGSTDRLWCDCDCARQVLPHAYATYRACIGGIGVAPCSARMQHEDPANPGTEGLEDDSKSDQGAKVVRAGATP